jgi:hypothetical protein
LRNFTKKENSQEERSTEIYLAKQEEIGKMSTLPSPPPPPSHPTPKHRRWVLDLHGATDEEMEVLD